jgi:hypothetical protein
VVAAAFSDILILMTGRPCRFMTTSVSLCCAAALLMQGASARRLRNTFDSGPEGWQVYDYNGGSGSQNVFYPVTWEKAGGVRNSGYVWGDDSRWRIDTPEQPNSILAFIVYRNWVKGDQLDLRDAKVSVYLRGDRLDLKGAKCYFWALDNQIGTRWHYVSQPLPVAEGAWGGKVTFTLKSDEKLWHRTWARNPASPASLDHVLRECDSYGFSFLGFSGEVTGKFAMDELEIEFAGK